MTMGIIKSLKNLKNLRKLLAVQKTRVQQLEVELSQIKRTKACLEEDFFHAIEQIQSIKMQQR
ncbi:MAG: hypothetical protein ABSA84_01765 [Gammaproteobacteria bacterium]|jgi:hypothetical protein